MTPRLRVLAGPNGSGKSSIFNYIKEWRENGKGIITGPFINADVIEKCFRTNGRLSLGDYGFDTVSPTLIADYLHVSTLSGAYSPERIEELISLEGMDIVMKGEKPDSYLGMFVADLLRETLLKKHVTFTMETVFSHHTKLDFMQRATDCGYKVYLYFVSTQSPDINVKRVEGRVADKGHFVPEDKIRQRYQRTMSQLKDALKIVHRAYIFDNSGEKTVKIAEKNTEGKLQLEKEVPQWLLTCLE